MADEKKYWFPRKTYGWGWGLPIAWQGWMAWALWLAGAVLLHVFFPPATHGVAFLVGFSAWVALLAAIHGGKGEPPGGWHWGD